MQLVLRLRVSIYDSSANARLYPLGVVWTTDLSVEFEGIYLFRIEDVFD